MKSVQTIHTPRVCRCHHSWISSKNHRPQGAGGKSLLALEKQGSVNNLLQAAILLFALCSTGTLNDFCICSSGKRQ
jgi:hypothetical protein